MVANRKHILPDGSVTRKTSDARYDVQKSPRKVADTTRSQDIQPT